MTPQQRLDLAQGFHTQGRYAAVLRLVAPLTARAPRTRADLDAQRLRAHAAYHLGRLAEAEQASLRVLTRRATDEAMMRLLVRVLQREGRHRDAAAWMTRLDELGTDTWDDTSTATPAQPAELTVDQSADQPAKPHRAA